uniref:HOIL-1/Sharpin LUBAC thetering domain-containing protein n=1 Tax=Oncorhynchus kisutch TaxID=8019 RepID=A0A8C7K1S8_ONCKI
MLRQRKGFLLSTVVETVRRSLIDILRYFSTAVEELAQLLSEAISCGDKEEAKRCLEQLAELCVPMSVRISHKAYSQDSIRLKLGVGDAHSDNYVPVALLVTLDMTISDLKEKINTNHELNPSLQSWVIGKRLNNENQAYLYIKSAHSVNLSWDQLNQEEARSIQNDVICEEVDQRITSRKSDIIDVGWSCPVYTYANKPAGYKVPKVYQPDKQEVQRLQLEKMVPLQYQQALEEEREKNVLSGGNGRRVLVSNTEELDCPICYCSLLPVEGCLKGTIVNKMYAEVTCPYEDENYSCDSKLHDREIKSLLSREENRKFLELRLSITETWSENSYQCKTPDCAGWGIFEDEVNEFMCELCREQLSPLQGMNCKEFQDDLRIRAEKDMAERHGCWRELKTAGLGQGSTSGEQVRVP